MTKRGRPRKERYARLMGGCWRHPKVRRLSLEARGVLLMAWSYAADQATDGTVPVELLQAWAGKRYKAILAELTKGSDEDGKRPFLVLDQDQIDATVPGWGDVNISVEEWERRLDSDRKRKRKASDIPPGNPAGKGTDNPPGNPAEFQPGALDEDEDEDESSLKSEQASGAEAPDRGRLAAREGLLARLLAALHRGWDSQHLARLAAPSPPAHLEALRPLGVWCAEYLETHDDDPDDLVERLLAGFWGRADLRRPSPRWLAEDPLRYVTGTDAREARAPRRTTDRLLPGSGLGFSEDDIAPTPAQREVRYG